MEERRWSGVTTILVTAGIVAILSGSGLWLRQKRACAGAMTTPCQAVLLSNGAACFGRLEELGKKTANVLVKRGNEWHLPGRMILNSNMIVLMEPVNPASRVAQLIAEARNR